jgi:hypothetical protein
MIREQSSKQTVLDFYLPFEGKLDPDNRWVKLADTIPWDALGAVYNRSIHSTMGAPAIASRVVIGAMIIKHMKKLSDEEVIRDISENPYYQYFLGFKDFQYRKVFVPSLFVAIRKRLGAEQLQEINHLFLSEVEDKNDHEDPPPPPSSTDAHPTKREEKRSGMLIMDASVAPSDIRYPTDVDLLNQAREDAEAIIDALWDSGKGKVKPRTYRRLARKAYLSFSHQRKPGKKKIRKAIGKQLGYLFRDLGHIDRMLDECEGSFPLTSKQQRRLWVIRELYRQQAWMYNNRKHSIEDRIVSLSQPHVRPIVRGKAGKKTEFGAKLSAAVISDNVYLDNISWDAYNESSDLIRAVREYRERFGFYPESVNADKIYWNRANRQFLKSNGIKLYGGKPLGRPSISNQMRAEEKRKHRKESNRRNWIEAKFGEGKRRYGLGLVMSKTRRTSESWIAMVIFVINVARYWRKIFLCWFLWAAKAVNKLYKRSNETVLMSCTPFPRFDTSSCYVW